MRAERGRRVLLVSVTVLLLTLVLAAGVGAVNWQELNPVIFWDIRLPRVLMGALAGLGLSVAGGAYQGLFKNPLADPSILGVSSGAALGGATAIAFLSHLHISSVGTVPLFAFLGGIAAVSLVYRLAAVGRRVPVVGLLLAGVAVGSFSIALVSLILYFTSQQARDAIVFWMMGGLGGANWEKVAWLLPYMTVGVGVLLCYWRELNALLLGEESALHLGVDVEYLKRVVLAAGTLLTAAAVAFCGTIGFVGLVVPHLVRFLVGPDHRYLLPVAGVVGAVVLVLADTLARSVLPTELPVGLVMAVLGGPFFLWLLRRKLQPPEA